MKFNEKLKLLRKRNKLSQEQIANYLGVGQTTYSKYENERTYPDINTVKKIAKLYGITIDQLVSDNDEKEYTIKVTEKELHILKSLLKKIETSKIITINENTIN